MPTLWLHRGRERSLKRHHPWVFSGAVARVDGAPGPGDTVDLRSADGELLARAAFSPHSQIRARVWTFVDEPVDEGLIARRLAAAVAARGGPAAGAPDAAACRLVYAESDGLPGVIVDRYADTLVVQLLTAGAEHWRATIAGLLPGVTGVQRVWERSDVEVRSLEGLEPRVGPLAGDPPPPRLEIREGRVRLWVDVHHGHKTGAYLDQRHNRARIGELANGRRVLDAFCYAGGFTVHALAGGAASVLAIDGSAEALAMARANLELNGLAAERCELAEGNVFEVLRGLRDRGSSFDLIVLDPPKFAATASQRQGAARGYKDINLLAFKLLAPGGVLATFSCSGAVSGELFQSIVAGAALDAGVEAQVVERLGQAADHPVLLSFPEAEYLKGMVCRVGRG
ncbi:MAG: 23S rRNA (cytosine(1962)-C(5))-methyltransferase RlmI [Holophagae bacterium]|nr:MAG: 23S rRNA (cytosine(1962)-C(5))-methyltransferase RlmI [Holophagae bacterium]